MIEPVEREIDGKIYILSKFPAVAGREIVALYPISGMPKVGDYKVNQETMLKLMAYVAVPMPNGVLPLQLKTRELVDNHVTSWETLAKIEMAMMEYNCSFFGDGRLSSFLGDTVQKVPAWISKMLTVLSAQSSQADKPPSTN